MENVIIQVLYLQVAETVKALEYKITHIGNKVAWEVSAKQGGGGRTFNWIWDLHGSYTL